MSLNSCLGQPSAESVFCKAGLVWLTCASKGGQMNESEDVVVGIDVAKAVLDMAIRPSGEAQHLANEATESWKRSRGCRPCV
jgi:hypothetical protein